MKAMILAAGLGTRLRPLTDDRPKALVEVAGRTMLEIAIRRLASFGIRDVIVNVHHFADMVVDYLKNNSNFGMHVEISREETLLDTGGGLKKAAWFFCDGAADEPFILHNVDVVSTIDVDRMVRSHRESGALATLAVQERKTSRFLLFDQQSELCGRRNGDKAPEMVRQAAKGQALAFCGIQVISPRLLSLLDEDGAFSIVSAYLRLAGDAEKIVAFRADDWYWQDIGKPENLAQVTLDAAQGLVRL
jgi:NDP-sugar pyrophosphorylase family protein